MCYYILMEEKQQPPKRKRGVQPGNHNRRTHGYYSRLLLPPEAVHILSARDLDGLALEVALARVKIAAIQRASPESYTTMFRAMSALIRLVNAQKRLEEGPARGRRRTRRYEFKDDDF